MNTNTSDNGTATRRVRRPGNHALAPRESNLCDCRQDIQIRALDETDHERIKALYWSLSPQTLYRRFHTPASVLRPHQLQFLLSADGSSHFALGAVRDDELLADARLIRIPEDRATAEIAVTVADSAQGQGLGRRLLNATADTAQRNGVARLLYNIQSDNEAAVRLLAACGKTLSRSGSHLTGVIDLGAMPVGTNARAPVPMQATA